MIIKELARDKVGKGASRDSLPVNVGIRPGADKLLEIVGGTGSFHLTVFLGTEAEERSESLSKSVQRLSPLGLALFGRLNRRHILADKVTLGGIVETSSHNAEDEAIIKLILVLHIKEHKSPKVLPRAHNREEPSITLKCLRLIVCNPKNTLERLVSKASTLLYGLGLFILTNLYLSGYKAEVEGETDS